MPVDLSSYKVTNGELSSATKFNNLVQATQDALNALPPAQIVGYPSSAATFLRGDGLWAGAISTYVPVWTAATTAPAIGNGTLAGRYLQVGKKIFVYISMTAGGTTTFGAGAWFFSLPVLDSTSAIHHGSGFAQDASPAAQYTNTVRIETGLQKVSVWTQASPAGTYAAATPFAWASGDVLQMSLAYEAA